MRDEFQALTDFINSESEFTKTQKDFLLNGVTYFRTQSLCDLDRKKDSSVLKKEWSEFKRFLTSKKLKRNFSDTFWNKIEGKIGVIEAPLFDVKLSIPKYDNLSVEDFLWNLSHEVERKAKSVHEKMLLSVSLWFLISQHTIPGAKRKQDNIKLVWNFIHPHLDRLDVLKPYKDSPKLKRNVLVFITGDSLFDYRNKGVQDFR